MWGSFFQQDGFCSAIKWLHIFQSLQHFWLPSFLTQELIQSVSALYTSTHNACNNNLMKTNLASKQTLLIKSQSYNLKLRTQSLQFTVKKDLHIWYTTYLLENVLNKSLLGSFAKFSSMDSTWEIKVFTLHKMEIVLFPESLISKVKNQLSLSIQVTFTMPQQNEDADIVCKTRGGLLNFALACPASIMSWITSCMGSLLSALSVLREHL